MSAHKRPGSAHVTRAVSAPERSWIGTVLYAALAAAALIAVTIVVRTPPASFAPSLRLATAVASEWLIVNLTAIPVTLTGTELRLANHVLRIDYLCTAVDLMVIYLLVVALVPVSWASKLKAVVWGVPFIVATNLARIVGLAVVSQWAPQYFRAVHNYTFEAFMVLAVAGTWAVWLWTCRDELRGPRGR